MILEAGHLGWLDYDCCCQPFIALSFQQDPYRIVPVHPADYTLLGITWQGQLYLDRALPFGLRSAPKRFNAVAYLTAWVLHCRGIQHQTHYLDDFLLAPLSGEAYTRHGVGNTRLPRSISQNRRSNHRTNILRDCY